MDGQPLHVSLVAIPDAVISTLSGIYDVLNAFGMLAETDPAIPRQPPFLVEIVGEAHAQEFEVACEIPKLAVRTLGRGPSRRIAEQQSAELALAAVRKK